MASYPNPYSNVIASFNRQSPADNVKEGKVPEEDEDEDDPQHLPDDDLLLWANAQFTFDNQTPGAGSYEDELALKIAQSQHQQLQAQQFQLQHQHHQQQQQQQQQQQIQNSQYQQHPNLQQPQANALLPSIPLQSNLQHPQHIQHPQHSQHSQHLPHSQQHGSSHVLQPYHLAEMQRQLQQFDAIHGYLDGSTEDPRSSLSLVERSRQRNPVTPGVLPQQQQQQQLLLQQQLQGQPFDSRLLHSVYAQQQQQQQQQQSAASSSAGSHHQAMVAQQHCPPYSMGASGSLPSSSMNQFQKPQHHVDAQHAAPNSSNSNHAGDRMSSSASATMTTTRDRNNSVNAGTLSTLSLHDTSSTAAAGGVGRTLTSHEEKLLQLETELEVYESELAEERRLQQQEHLHQQQRQSSADMTDAEGEGGPNDSGNDSSANSAQSPSNNAGAPPTSSSSGGGEYLDAAARLAAEEDKRRRNTAASARFRHKKRLREQILERTAKEMTAKSEILEIRVRELEMEIKWLRGLIVEKDAGRGLLVEGVNALAASASSGSGLGSLGTNVGGHLPGLAPRGTGGSGSSGGVEGNSGKASSALRSKRPQ